MPLNRNQMLPQQFLFVKSKKEAKNLNLIQKIRRSKFDGFGHATILILINGKYIITDPILSSYASPIPRFFKRVTPAPIDEENFPQIS